MSHLDPTGPPELWDAGAKHEALLQSRVGHVYLDPDRLVDLEYAAMVLNCEPGKLRKAALAGWIQYFHVEPGSGSPVIAFEMMYIRFLAFHPKTRQRLLSTRWRKRAGLQRELRYPTQETPPVETYTGREARSWCRQQSSLGRTPPVRTPVASRSSAVQRRVDTYNPRDPDQLVSAGTAATLLDCSERRLVEVAHARQIPHYMVGGMLRFRYGEVEEWRRDGRFKKLLYTKAHRRRLGLEG